MKGTTTMTQVHDSEAIFHSLWAALERRDIDAAADHFAEDALILDFADPGNPCVGRPAIRALLEGYFDLMPDLAFELKSVLPGQDRLAAELVLTGTPSGQTTAAVLHYAVFHVYEDGKIRAEHLYVDSARLPAGL